MRQRVPVWLLLFGIGCDSSETKSVAVSSAPVVTEEPSVVPSPQVQTDTHVAQSGPSVIGDALTQRPLQPTRTAYVPMRLPSSDRVERVRAILRGVIESHGLSSERPAVLIHALLALGPEIRTEDDRPAIDALFSDWATRLELDGQGLIQFPRKSGETMVEAHRGIVLKTLSEIGVSPDYPVQVDGHDFTLARLYQTTLLQTWASMSGNGISPAFSGSQDLAWVLQGLSTWSPSTDMTWKTLDGHTQTLEDFSIYNYAVLHTDTQPLFLAQNGEGQFQKKTVVNGKVVPVGPYNHSCGAAHALQASAYTVARGYGDKPLVQRGMQGQVSNMFWRIGKEIELTDSFLARPDLDPTDVDWLLVQQLKSTGHFLESMSKIAALGYYTPDDAQQKLLSATLFRLMEAVLKLEERGTFDDLPRILTDEPQLFMDLINDSAHALSGLELALGERAVLY